MMPAEGSKGFKIVDALLYGAFFTLGAWGMRSLLDTFTDDDKRDDDRDDADDDSE